MKPATLSGQVLAWVIATLAVVWAAFAVIGYTTGAEEAVELSDAHLVGVAQTTLGDPLAAAALNLEYASSLTITVWDAEGHLLRHQGPAPRPNFDAAEGFHTVELGQPAASWRSFTRWSSDPPRRKVTVLVDAGVRETMALDVAGDIAEPGLWLLPVAVLLLGLVVRRGLRPLRELSQEVNALDVHHPAPLKAGHRHAELQTVAAAIDTLGARYEAALQREQQLASELAHELRTPLTSIALQAHALRQSLGTAEGESALQRLEQDALRAGAVLGALLSMARASRTEMAESTQPVELCELARRVTAEYAQAALDSGHDLGFQGDEPMVVQGHPVLLELALRNLIDNALGHTAAGTRVEVQVDAAERWLQVCDSGVERAGANAARTTHTLGLGLGHRVVEKVAAVHQARFAAVNPPPGFAHAYRIAWEAPHPHSP